ncbi:VOC family protein [Saccharospirillum sp.]|uniref:VOC family protein n=1 Tax=Saccharospirillum sp. TaxID=2033801 RepID=UPI0034A0348A
MSIQSPALSPFHLAFPVHDLAAARQFYGEVLGCAEGRSSDHWIDFDFFGHQIVAHLSDKAEAAQPISNAVDGHEVPVPHFGVVLSMEEWQAMADRLTAMKLAFVIEPYIRFKGQPGEQGTLFFRDPSGNAIEMKGFADRSSLFAT